MSRRVQPVLFGGAPVVTWPGRKGQQLVLFGADLETGARVEDMAAALAEWAEQSRLSETPAGEEESRKE